jgi:hypothetical protein
VIHDWEDQDALRILEVVRRTIREAGTLLLIERVIAPPNQGWDAKFSDLNMLVATGGYERTAAEFAALLEAARFQQRRIIASGVYSVIEAAPA